MNSHLGRNHPLFQPAVPTIATSTSSYNGLISIDEAVPSAYKKVSSVPFCSPSKNTRFHSKPPPFFIEYFNNWKTFRHYWIRLKVFVVVGRWRTNHLFIQQKNNWTYLNWVRISNCTTKARASHLLLILLFFCFKINQSKEKGICIINFGL